MLVALKQIMKYFLIRLIGVLLTTLPLSAITFAQSDAYSQLNQHYMKSIETARGTLQNPSRPSGFERFLLAFGSGSKFSRDERIGRILLAAHEQDKIIQRYINKQTGEDFFEPSPANQFIVSTALQTLKTRLKMSCAVCKSSQDLIDYRRTVDEYFEVFNITDAHSGFSGLPFTKLMQVRFFDPTFQKQVTDFHNRLEYLLENAAQNSDKTNYRGLQTNLWHEAIATTQGNEGAAVELLGLLMSRDVLITRYFKYMQVDNKEFLHAFAMVPITSRLLAELDREFRHDDRDIFSYDGRYAPKDDRSYYFWSAALASRRLHEAGHPERFIKLVSLEFARQYKVLRYFEQAGFSKDSVWYKKFYNNSLAALLTSGKGSKLGISAEVSVLDDVDLNAAEKAYLNSLSLDGTSEEQLKKDWVRQSLKNGVPNGRAAILLYDFANSKAGFSHMKFAIGSEVFEIHRFPNKSGSYLRERPLMESLLDAKAGSLPSGILEFEISDELKEKVIANLRDAADASMQYSFFNKVFNSDAFNCAGIIFESIKLAGFPLPHLASTDAFPFQIFAKMSRSIRNARVLGNSGKWSENFVKPNWEVATFTGANQKVNADFKGSVGSDWLKAEQALSASTPVLSNWRNLLGYLIPSFSSNGLLKEEYIPKNGNTLKLKTFLLPASLANRTYVTESVSENIRNIEFVDIKGKQYLRVFIHPNEVDQYAELEKQSIPDPVQWIATPSSSARSLYVQDANGKLPVFAVKTSLSVEMGGANRLIDHEKLSRAVVVSELISEIYKNSNGLLAQSEKSWEFMAEPVAVLPSTNVGGFILRNLPENSKNRIFLPLYSLISTRVGRDRWIDELYRYSGRSSKLEFVTKDLIAPMNELHNLLSIENGLTTELHQQNLLIEVDPITRKIKGLIVRDMDANWIDHSLRVGKLGKKAIQTDSFKSAAYDFRYAIAQENQIKSYTEILRTRSIEWLMKYFLNANDLQLALAFSDHNYIHAFNQKFPEYAVQRLAEMPEAWNKLHASVTSPEEKNVYFQIKKQNSKLKPSRVLELVRWFQSGITANKMNSSPKIIFPRCQSVFGD